MNTTDRSHILAEEILSWFEEGIAIDPHTKRYIDACFPGISLDILADRLCDAPDLDVAPLMDLIFFPNETLQIRLEPLLERESFSIEDEIQVAKRLSSVKIQTTLRETEHRCIAKIQIPTSVLAPLVHRLRIHRRIPPGLGVVIEKYCPPKEVNRLKVKLRNSRFSFTPEITDFLTALIRGIDTRADYFNDCLELALGLLDERKQNTAPLLVLEKRKEVLLRAKQTALQFEKQLRHSNMETLMHQGVRAPEIGVADAEKKIVLLDRIGRAAMSGAIK